MVPMLDQQRPPARFVHLATLGDANTARIFAARLEAEGIEVRLHGDAQSIYPVTVGALAETQLWVLSDKVEEASKLLLDAELNDVLEPLDRGEPVRRSGLPMELRLAALGVGLILLALWRLRIVAVY